MFVSQSPAVSSFVGTVFHRARSITKIMRAVPNFLPDPLGAGARAHGAFEFCTAWDALRHLQCNTGGRG